MLGPDSSPEPPRRRRLKRTRAARKVDSDSDSDFEPRVKAEPVVKPPPPAPAPQPAAPERTTTLISDSDSDSNSDAETGSGSESLDSAPKSKFRFAINSKLFDAEPQSPPKAQKRKRDESPKDKGKGKVPLVSVDLTSSSSDDEDSMARRVKTEGSDERIARALQAKFDAENGSASGSQQARLKVKQDESDHALAQQLSSEADSGDSDLEVKWGGVSLKEILAKSAPAAVKPEPGVPAAPEVPLAAAPARPAPSKSVIDTIRQALKLEQQNGQPAGAVKLENGYAGAGPSNVNRGNSPQLDDMDGINDQPQQPGNEQEDVRDLLKRVENNLKIQVTPRELRIKTPWQMMTKNVNLLEHQKIGVEWMEKQERGANKGGILADDMGLGKTIQTIALLLTNPSKDPKRKATLVVCPTSLLYQWEKELQNRTADGTFKIFIHHGPKKAKKATDFKGYDVVLTTYGTIGAEFPKLRNDTKGGAPLLGERGREEADAEYERDREELEDKAEVIRVQAGPVLSNAWHRVVLDEAHTIKNKRTKQAWACRWLNATFRWCLTGTPFQNSVEELYSLLQFLDIKPYCEWPRFREDIVKRLRRGHRRSAVKLVQILLAGICLRRTKTSTIDGKPILASLPPKTIHHDIVHFSPAEREFYTALEQRTRLRFNKYLREGRVLQNYANILALLSRLRQAVCHPSLIKVGMAGVGDGGDVADRNGDARDEEALARKLPADAINRVKEQGLTALECAICMDEAIPIQDGVFLSGCGHPYCRLCIESFIEEGAPNGCPLCRAEVDEDVSKLVPFITFQRLFMPETINKGPEPVDDDDDEEEEESDEDAPEFQSSAKIDRCLEILENIRAQGKGEKAICFTQWRGMHKLLGTAMARRGMKYVSIDGSLSIKRRAEAVDIFAADPKCNILIISLKCGSLGLNLTCANHVILTDCWWNPQIEAQAMDRAHRFGQLKPVSVHRITVHETVEDRIMELQEQKQKVFDAAFDGGSLKKIGGRLNIQDLIKLFGRDDDDPLAYSDEDEA